MIKCGLPSSIFTRRYSIVLPVLYFMAFIFLAQLGGGLGESPIDWATFLVNLHPMSFNFIRFFLPSRLAILPNLNFI